MSQFDDQQFDPRLIERHLRPLEATTEDEAELQRSLVDDPQLANQNRMLTRAFTALSRLGDERAPDDLGVRIALRIAAAPAPLRVARPTDRLTHVLEARNLRERGGGYGSLRDIVAIAAMIVLAVGVGVPSVLHMKEQRQRLVCTDNLRRIGAGLQQYARTFNASLPFAGWSSRSTWAAADSTGAVAVPNRTHVYPLLRLKFITDPNQFVCPGRKDTPMSAHEINQRDSFLEARNLSYAYYNMAGVRPRMDDSPDLPIMADDNPLFEEGLPLLDARIRSFGDLARANSESHHGAGQNVLTLGGVVRWTRTPYCGVNQDNIWLLEGVQRYTGREGPLAASDTQLIK